MSDLVPFLLIVVVVVAVGVGVGMLVAPRLERLTARDDEETGDGSDPPD